MEKKHAHQLPSGGFYSALKRLEGGFLSIPTVSLLFCFPTSFPLASPWRRATWRHRNLISTPNMLIFACLREICIIVFSTFFCAMAFVLQTSHGFLVVFIKTIFFHRVFYIRKMNLLHISYFKRKKKKKNGILVDRSTVG